jgi:hypothetical protein
VSKPYIVASRASKVLLQNLSENNFPILFEGVHTTYFLKHPALTNNRKFVRLHNTEFVYYKNLAINENNLFKRIYYNIESALLKRYETSVAQYVPCFAVSEQDRKIYDSQLHAKDVKHLNVLLPFSDIHVPGNTGNFCLYHGNLSVNENIAAVRFLMEYCFQQNDIPFKVAGLNPDARLKQFLQQFSNTELIENPSDAALNQLIAEAQVNILPSMNETGVKLKILNALFNGRHCVTNEQAVRDMPESVLCTLYQKPELIHQTIQELMQQPVSNEMINKRKEVLLSQYNNAANITQLITWIFPHYPIHDPLRF